MQAKYFNESGKYIPTKKQLLEMAEQNAADYLSKSVNKIKHKNDVLYVE